jgi:uncharacterized protein (DUF885 family)
MSAELTDPGQLVSDFAPSITLLEEAIKVLKNIQEVALKEDRKEDAEVYEYQIQSHDVAIQILQNMMGTE